MINTKIIVRYFVMLVGSAVAGLISGLFYPTQMGVRGAILGISLAFGVVCINILEHKQLLSGQSPRRGRVVLIGVISGLVSGLLMNLYGTGPAMPKSDFPPEPTPHGLPTFLVGIAYGLFVHGAYSLRWRYNDTDSSNRRFLPTLGMFILAGILVTIMRFQIMTLYRTGLSAELVAMLAGSLMFSLFSGLPFVLLWGIVVSLSDPAWSHKIFKKCM